MKRPVLFLSIWLLTSTLIGCSGSDPAAPAPAPSTLNAVETPSVISAVTAQ